ncbi:HNH endonuclease [Clostridium collagenovorans DSM 3089]|uniref:HNH endonuclease n=1 Tax=Clostridium collagenovorans DSM 3089 TaxID=1121306 RepID=A0A1M5XVW1_9CLOT|nr:HNH endonuclease signature motif containing protein [Clostridium collagenovorans]SHI03967.1 HNH endonuclease [Clostridium collagenovorans DSM 3089]
MAIPDNIVAEVLSKSARHCCVCRNFLPLKIQVHHIIEKNDGGTDDIDNLIPICIDCHASIHTITNMTRKFTSLELKKSRDTVYDMVINGKLPAFKPLTRNEIEMISSTLVESLKKKTLEEPLSNEAMYILTTSLSEQSPILVNSFHNNSFQVIVIGTQHIVSQEKSEGQYPMSIIELLSKGYIEVNKNQINISVKGIHLLETLINTTATFTQKKAKCLSCGLHFILCSWHKDKHDSSSLHCPECGQSNGNFLVWSQQKFGFIFEDVPGKANLYSAPK